MFSPFQRTYFFPGWVSQEPGQPNFPSKGPHTSSTVSAQQQLLGYVKKHYIMITTVTMIICHVSEQQILHKLPNQEFR